MKLIDYRFLVKSDLHRYCGANGSLFKTYLSTPGFQYIFWFRTTRYLKESHLILFPLYLFSYFKLRRLQFKYGISIPYNTEIGSGLYIGHFGGIVVNHQAIIGKNCNINHGVTIGATYGGKCPGTPKIGDNVYIGPGSIIIGGVEIGNHVAIGAHTLVNKTIPSSSIFICNSGAIISSKGSVDYIINTDY